MIFSDLAGSFGYKPVAAVLSILTGMAVMLAGAPMTQAKARAQHFGLANGMQVVVIPDHRAPVVTHMVWYRVGAADEPHGVSGIAHFLEHLMFKGTDKIPPGEFSKIVSRNGGQDNAFTSHDATAYFQRIARDRLPLVMEMEADRMRNLKLAEKDVLTERDVILEERRSRVENDPGSILREQLMATLYQSHGYGVPVLGWKHEMKTLSRADALAFYKRFYAPNNAILVVAGDVTVDEVRKLAEKTYAKLEPTPDLKARKRPQEPTPRAAKRVILEDARAPKITVQRLYQVPSYTTAKPGEAEALDLMMKIVAGGSTSRLYKALVVDQKVAASAGGWYSGTGLDSGRLALYGVAADKVSAEALEAALEKVIAEVRDEGVTQAELDRARKSYLAATVYDRDSQSKLARTYGWALSTGRSIGDVEQWPDRLKAVTVEDIQKAAKAYFNINRSATGVLLPAGPAAEAGSSRTPGTAPKTKS